MKLSHLKQIALYLQKFKKISAAYRVSDTIVKIVFDKDDAIYFDMKKGNGTIFRCKEYPRSKVYNAPFDVLLAKRLNRANVEDVALVNNDKILRIKTALSSAYKEQITIIQFEFTGKNTNVILLDEEGVVLEALRHIDLFSSFREVRVGQKLLDVPPPPFVAKEYPLEDVEQFLYGVYEEQQRQKLATLKKQKLRILEKKLQKFQNAYDKLDSQEALEQEAQELEHLGGLVLSQAHTIKPYTTKLSLTDYDGTTKELTLEKGYPTPYAISEILFAKAKKAKQKAKHLHIEEASLREKIEHTKRFIHTVKEAQDTAKIEMLFPKQQTGGGKKTKQDDSIETFWIEGYKVQLGKNERGNVKLLESAKARDIWLHLKDCPSTHVIITTDKQNLPEHIIKAAARLCVDFSTTSKDRFLVDYTPRREVSIQNGANVLYNKYKTIEIDTRK